MKKGYRVTLTDEEQQELRSVVNSGKAEGKKDRHNSRGNLFGVVPNCRSSGPDTIGVTMSTVYDKEGNVTKQFDGKGQFTLIAYDALNRRKTVTRAGAFENQRDRGISAGLAGFSLAFNGDSY